MGIFLASSLKWHNGASISKLLTMVESSICSTEIGPVGSSSNTHPSLFNLQPKCHHHSASMPPMWPLSICLLSQDRRGPESIKEQGANSHRLDPVKEKVQPKTKKTPQPQQLSKGVLFTAGCGK